MSQLPFKPDPQDPFFLECLKKLRAKGIQFPEPTIFGLYQEAYDHMSHVATFECFWKGVKKLGAIDVGHSELSLYNNALRTLPGELPRETIQKSYQLLTLMLTKELRTIWNLFLNEMLGVLRESPKAQKQREAVLA